MAQKASTATSRAGGVVIPEAVKRRSRTSSHDPKTSAAARRIGSLVLATSSATVAIGQASRNVGRLEDVGRPGEEVAGGLHHVDADRKERLDQILVGPASRPQGGRPELLLPAVGEKW